MKLARALLAPLLGVLAGTGDVQAGISEVVRRRCEGRAR